MFVCPLNYGSLFHKSLYAHTTIENTRYKKRPRFANQSVIIGKVICGLRLKGNKIVYLTRILDGTNRKQGVLKETWNVRLS